MPNPYASQINLFDRYDKRIIRELSNDEGLPDGQYSRIERLLDSAAGRLESALYGAFATPVVALAGNVSAAIAAGDKLFSVAAVPPGMYPGKWISVLHDTSSNPAEVVMITSVSGTTINILGDGAQGGFGYAHAAGSSFGHAAHVLTDYVCAQAADDLFGRRPSRPESLDKDLERQEKLVTDILAGSIRIPGIDRATTIQVHSSEGMCGSIVQCFP